MPFESKAQQRYMHSQHPEIAERWDKITDFSKLPERKGKNKHGSIANAARKASIEQGERQTLLR